MEVFQHNYKGFGAHPSKCMVYVKKVTNPRYGDTTFICFEDLGVGTSVTNASEQLATEIVEKLGLEPEKTRFFETYDKKTLDEISYSWLDYKASSPDWSRPYLDVRHVFNFK
jgi:hypothetical protein